MYITGQPRPPLHGLPSMLLSRSAVQAWLQNTWAHVQHHAEACAHTAPEQLQQQSKPVAREHLSKPASAYAGGELLDD